MEGRHSSPAAAPVAGIMCGLTNAETRLLFKPAIPALVQFVRFGSDAVKEAASLALAKMAEDVHVADNTLELISSTDWAVRHHPDLALYISAHEAVRVLLGLLQAREHAPFLRSGLMAAKRAACKVLLHLAASHPIASVIACENLRGQTGLCILTQTAAFASSLDDEAAHECAENAIICVARLVHRFGDRSSSLVALERLGLLCEGRGIDLLLNLAETGTMVAVSQSLSVLAAVATMHDDPMVKVEASQFPGRQLLFDLFPKSVVVPLHFGRRWLREQCNLQCTTCIPLQHGDSRGRAYWIPLEGRAFCMSCESYTPACRPTATGKLEDNCSGNCAGDGARRKVLATIDDWLREKLQTESGEAGLADDAASWILEIRSQQLSEMADSDEAESKRRARFCLWQQHCLLVALERAVDIIQGLSSDPDRKALVAQTAGMIEFLLEVSTCGPFRARAAAVRALQQLAYRDDEAQSRMCELGAVNVLVGLVRSSHREIRHEAARCFQWLGENRRFAIFPTFACQIAIFSVLVPSGSSSTSRHRRAASCYSARCGERTHCGLRLCGQPCAADHSGTLERPQHLQRSAWSTRSAGCE